METKCISNCRLGDTGFNYTMSLIQGKYKMIILYALMEFGVVRFNEMKKYIGTITFKTLSSTNLGTQESPCPPRHNRAALPANPFPAPYPLC